MQVETITEFFSALGVLPDHDIDVQQANITLDRLITARGKTAYVSDLMAALPLVNEAFNSHLKRNLAFTAVNAGIIKSAGRSHEDVIDPAKPRPHVERDFTAALALAQSWKNTCCPKAFPDLHDAAERLIATLTHRSLDYRPRHA